MTLNMTTIPISNGASIPVNAPNSALIAPLNELNSNRFISILNSKNTPDNEMNNYDKTMNVELPSDIDLEGGTLLSVEEREEIDPDDKCKVQITCYHILSADQTEERTVTRRRKLKVNCTQSLKRVEFSNGKGTKVEERTTVFNDVDAFREYTNCSGVHLAFKHSRDNSDASAKGNKTALREISDDMDDVLVQTQNTFLSLLNEKKEQLMLSFPELFDKLRTQPAIFQQIPSTTTRTVVNPDGSTTTHTESSKAFSSRYTCQETYLNGVRQETTAKFRAFMEYAGPEGGFCIRLNNADTDDGELSDSDENDTPSPFFTERVINGEALPQFLPPSNVATITKESYKQHHSSSSASSQIAHKHKVKEMTPVLSDDIATQQNDDGQSRISRSGISEIPDTVSALVTQEDTTHIPKLSSEPMKRREKAWHAVNELVESEGRYVQKLSLLEKFREEVEHEHVVERRQMSLLFSNIESLHRFHNDHLLPQLMDRRREWHSTQKISDVMRKQAPFLKMYSEYTNNYKRAVQIFEECMRKKKHFEEIVRRIEHMPECENLSLQSHLICPVQRVMRYQLLLKEYQKYLTAEDPDHTDTEVALTLVLEAASHANEMMRKLDRYRNVLEVQELLGNTIPLVSPSRELLTRAKLMKISSSTSKAEERLLFIFSDLFLLASERSSLMGTSKLKVRAIFDARHAQICEGDNFEREHSFYLRGADSASAPLRCVELCCNSQDEKNNLFEIIWSVIDEAQHNINTMNKTDVKDNNNKENSQDIIENGMDATTSTQQFPINSKCCNRCESEFTWYMRSYVCARCACRFCKKCFGQLRFEAKSNRLCNECFRRSVPLSMSHNELSSNSEESNGKLTNVSRKWKNLLATPAYDLSDAIKAGYVLFRGTLSDTGIVTRYFILRKNFCLYSYKTEKDIFASAMMPMAGCEITPGGSTDKLAFLIRHLHRVYHIQCANESEHAEWMAALILTANANLPASTDVSGASRSVNGERTPNTVKRSVSVGERIVHAVPGVQGRLFLKPPPHLNAPYGRSSMGSNGTS